MFHIRPLNFAALYRRRAAGDINIMCVFLHVKAGGEEGDEKKGTESDRRTDGGQQRDCGELGGGVEAETDAVDLLVELTESQFS